MRSEIKCAYWINFDKPNTIGSMLGFTSRLLKSNKWYESTSLINITNVNIIRIECSITTGAYANDKSVHTIHKFSPNVPPGYKISETPAPADHLPSGNREERYRYHSAYCGSTKTIDRLSRRRNHRTSALTSAMKCSC